MKLLKFAPLLLAFSYQASATVACNGLGVCSTTPGVVSGVMGNYDIANDTGEPAYGFEMDYENAHSSEIGFTWDWSRFGAPTIGEYTDANGVPHAVVRYQSPKDVNGNWTVHTIPATFPWATGGHQCTASNIDTGCEHFVTGMFASTTAQPTVVKYNWLVDHGTGSLIYGTGIGQPASGATMAIPALVAPAPVQPPAPAQPAPVQPAVVQVVPVQPAPAEKAPKAPAQWGDPVWLKVTKTSAHGKKIGANAADVVNALVDEDKNGDHLADWQNAEPAQVESEWYLIQSPPEGKNGGAKQQHNGAAEQVAKDETITRKYEWFDNVAPAGAKGSYDGETHEQMCDKVGPDGVHGAQTAVGVTDPLGGSYTFDCSAVPIVGNYLAGNMVAFENVMPLTQLEKIADVKVGTALAQRTTIFGGNSPYVVTTTGALPDGIGIDATNGIISGTPTVAGPFNFTVNVTDADGTKSSHAYTVNILDANGQPVVPAPVAPVCSGASETINAVTARNGNIAKFDGTLISAPYVTTNSYLVAIPANGVAYAFNAGVAYGSFPIGGKISYSGLGGAALDANNKPIYCIPTSVTVDPAPAPVVCNPPLTVRDAATNTCVVAPAVVCNPPLTVRDAATNTCVVAPAVVCNPPLTVRDAATNTCVVAPAVVCNPPLTVRDAATNTCVVAPPVVCNAPKVRDATTNTCITPVVPPASCAIPAGGKALSSGAQANVSGVTASTFVISGKTYNYLPCTAITWKGNWKGLTQAIRNGYNVEVKSGYTANGVIYTTSLIVDNNK